jgi:hypothetical protein
VVRDAAGEGASWGIELHVGSPASTFVPGRDLWREPPQRLQEF